MHIILGLAALLTIGVSNGAVWATTRIRNHHRGYDHGYTDGYADGHDMGHADGFCLGHEYGIDRERQNQAAV